MFDDVAQCVIDNTIQLAIINSKLRMEKNVEEPEILVTDSQNYFRTRRCYCRASF